MGARPPPGRVPDVLVLRPEVAVAHRGAAAVREPLPHDEARAPVGALHAPLAQDAVDGVARDAERVVVGVGARPRQVPRRHVPERAGARAADLYALAARPPVEHGRPRARVRQQALNRRARVFGDVQEPERAAHVRPAGAQAARLPHQCVRLVVAPRLGAALEGVGPERGAERPPQRPHVV